MKKCRRCSKPATLHITEIRKSEVAEIHLCEVCAKDYLTQADGAASDESPEMEFDKLEEAADALDVADDPVCPNCGITFREFRKQGRLGCSHDYAVFQSLLLPLIENIHGETEHVGKRPRRAPDTSHRQHQLLRLRGELKAAIEEENYEAAAALRDEIQAVEGELRSPGTAE